MPFLPYILSRIVVMQTDYEMLGLSIFIFLRPSVINIFLYFFAY